MPLPRFLSVLALSLAAFAQTPDPAIKAAEGLNALLWTQTSTEYAALARQTYRSAEAALLRALDDVSWTAALEQLGDAREKTPAVILDLDETVLDNSAFQARLVASGKPYTDAAWTAWVAEKRAGTVPGALEFLRVVQMSGVIPIYITNRACNPVDANDPTVALLRQLDVPLSASTLLCREKSSDKSGRRAIASATYRILLLIGDDFNDFLTAGATAEKRTEQLRVHQRFFGDRWFLLPNPMYGSWERVIPKTLPALRLN